MYVLVNGRDICVQREREVVGGVCVLVIGRNIT